MLQQALPSLPNFTTARNYIGGENRVNIEFCDASPCGTTTYRRNRRIADKFSPAGKFPPFAPLAAPPQTLFPEHSSRPAQSAADSEGEIVAQAFCACASRHFWQARMPAPRRSTRTWTCSRSSATCTSPTAPPDSLLPPGTMDLVCERLCDLAWRASWRADGSYRPIDRIDLVLLGDVLDIMGSRRWLASPCRPWDDHQSPAVIDAITRHRRGNPPPQRRLHPHAALAGHRSHRQPAAGHGRRPAGAGSRGNARRRLHALHGGQPRLAAAPARARSTT